MFKLLTKIPRNINIAFSGGVDSLAAAHFLKRNHNVTLLHFNHGCAYSDRIENDCRKRAKDLDLPILVGRMGIATQEKGQSLEDFWRRCRYRWLRSFDERFITCHHLDDAAETWVMSALHGNPKLIPVQDELVLRPFLITEKQKLESYATKHNLIPVEDEFNSDYSLTRNYIRRNMMPQCYNVNPGLNKVIRKKYLEIKDET
jgi:tRNA(Ile)-lysidine synthase